MNMIKLISLDEMQISNLNDIQHIITRMIMNNDRFTWEEIHQKIKDFLIYKESAIFTDNY